MFSIGYVSNQKSQIINQHSLLFFALEPEVSGKHLLSGSNHLLNHNRLTTVLLVILQSYFLEPYKKEYPARRELHTILNRTYEIRT